MSSFAGQARPFPLGVPSHRSSDGQESKAAQKSADYSLCLGSVLHPVTPGAGIGDTDTSDWSDGSRRPIAFWRG